MNLFGSKLRKLRETQGLLLRQVAAYLETDTAYISKLEHGERRAKREQVLHLATILKINPDELLALWLADQLFCILQNEKLALDAMQIVEMEYQKMNNERF